MLFNSLHFVIFFPVAVVLYYAVPFKYRWIPLLVCSYYFYMCWKAEYVILIMISTLIDYFASIKMAKYETKSKRKPFLFLSLLTNLGLLIAFKYFNFLNESVRTVLNYYNIFYDVPMFNVLLPVGISFYTFQTLSYSIDVYRGNQKPEKHLGIFALYVSFFPQLVAGPIERSPRLLPQFYQRVNFDYVRVTDGLKLMAWGFFKKLVIADRVGILVNQVYNSPTDYSGVPLIIATYFFAFQIYCDFSGYSDIAIGGAKVMGFNLMTNFRQPYFSTSIAEFWKRWHISLSTWFRDYLYIPLGGNRVSKLRWYFNLIVVFLVSGMWHGANWTFLIWGGIHGVYLASAIITMDFRSNLKSKLHLDKFPTFHRFIKIFCTFHLVLIAWVFFRANSLTDALYVIRSAFVDFTLSGKYALDFGHYNLLLSIVSLMALITVESVQQRTSLGLWLKARPAWFRWLIYYMLILCIALFGQYQTNLEFIYFQF